MNRRTFVQSSAAAAALGLTGCRTPQHPAAPSLMAQTLPPPLLVPPLAPIRSSTDRLIRVTVCTRPFRAQGPRIEPERIGDKLVIHNYGHGGSGWSLSWGSAAVVAPLAMRNGNRTIAVVGCGALGLTAATLLQREGCHVTIYAKERPSETRSFRATGSWTPDSRVALLADAPPAFAAQWESMARYSYRMYESFLGLPGSPIQYSDRYSLSDLPPAAHAAAMLAQNPIGFARYEDRLADLTPQFLDLPPGTHPFPTLHARRTTSLQFNISAYSHQLLEDFLVAGGKLQTAEFHTPADLAALPENVIVNCTGYGARALFADDSLTPVRGQIGWLIPQPEVTYGLYFERLNILSRTDGIVVQSSPQGEASGWNNPSETPDPAEAEAAVHQLAALYTAMRARTPQPINTL